MGLPLATIMDLDVRVTNKAYDEYDIRLERRLKRRCIANKKFSSKYVKKTTNTKLKIEHAPLDVDVPDEDYAQFLKYFCGINCGDRDNEADAFARCLYDGHGNVKMDKDNDQYIDPPGNLCLIDDYLPIDVDENDEDYAVFFNRLVRNIDDNNDGAVSSRCSDDGHDNVKNMVEDDQDADPQHDMCMDNDHDYPDPQYKIFLENLREHGQSYVLEVVTNYGMSMLVNYEGEKELFDGLMLDPQGTVKSWRRKETETARILRSASKKEKIKSLNNLGNVLDTERTEKTGRTLRNASRRGKTESPHALSGGSQKETMVALETFRDVMGKENKNSKRDLKVGNKDLFTGLTNGCNSNMRESDTTDEDYQEFLSCLKNDGGYAIYTPESGIPLKYEQDVECSNDSEIVGIDKDPFSDGCFTPFIASRLDSIIDLDVETSNGSPGGYSNSQFRKRLMEILKSPYDAKEYEYLQHEVSCRRQMERDRELRNGTKSYALDSVGKSYLDQHHDFAREIDSVQHDQCRVLNLLRGFFFWLQNLVHEGAFQPWKDSCCLNILPEM